MTLSEEAQSTLQIEERCVEIKRRGLENKRTRSHTSTFQHTPGKIYEVNSTHRRRGGVFDSDSYTGATIMVNG